MKLACPSSRKVPFTVICLLGIGCTDAPLTPTPDMAEPSFTRGANHLAPTDEWVQEVFIDRRDDPTHVGPGPHPTEESSKFSLSMGGISWFENASPLKYEISGAEAVTDGNGEIEGAVALIAGFITTRDFVRDDGSPDVNPCGGFNRVVWASIDGPGNILASAGVCRSPATKEIAGFVVTLDTGEDWSVSGQEGKFDVLNVSVHEFGHVAGLNHVNAPRDGCLTMYKIAGPGETQKRTLGLGDKLGLNALYASADVAAGACGS